MKKVITIGREFGSGGREIGRRIAEKLQIAYYDQEIVTEIAKRTKLSEEYVERITEDRPYMSYPIHVGTSFYMGYYAYTEIDRSLSVFAEQHSIILELADRSDCVIVGRCADYILKDNPDVISVFCYSDVEERIQWSIDEYQVPAKQAKKIVQEKDAQRSRFYEFYTNQKWGNPRNYTLMINTSKMSTEETVQLLASFYDAKKGILTFKNAFENQYEKDNKY